MTEHRKSQYANMALALALLVGCFSLFSLTFGLKKVYEEKPTELAAEVQKPVPILGASIPEIENVREYRDLTDEERAALARADVPENPEARYVLNQLERLGVINARSFLVGDLDTGEIIFERKPNEIYPIASITKYMTAYTAAERLMPNELVEITSSRLQVEGNRGRFEPGDFLTIRDMLYPLLLVSSNDAGEIIAQHRQREVFIDFMNATADGVGMTNTNFEDPTGLSQNNVSTARDLFTMMRTVQNDYPQIVDISRLSFKENGDYLWRNINRAASFPEFRGGKTGYTNAARQTSIGYYQIQLANDEIKNIGVVILQSNTRQQDTRNLLDYLKRYVAYL